MRIGELAKRASVSASRIRFYEAEGILPPASRLANGYRDYGEGDVTVAQFIERAQGLGFTLREVAKHLGSPQGDARKARLQVLLEKKLAEVDLHLEQARTRRAVILDLIDEVRSSRAAA